MKLSAVRVKNNPGYPSGQSVAEYAAILGAISIVAIAALTATGGQVNNRLPGMVAVSMEYHNPRHEKELPPPFLPWKPGKRKAKVRETWIGLKITEKRE